MATYTPTNGVLVCTGTNITTAGIVAAVNTNSGSLNTVGGAPASATTYTTEQGYRTSIIEADFDIGDGGTTASTWVAEDEHITVWANLIRFNGANVRFGLKRANGTFSYPVSFFYDSSSNANSVAGWERWKLENGGLFEAYGCRITTENLLTYETTVGDVILEDCFISISDGLGDGSGTFTTTGNPTITYRRCVVDNHIGVGIKLYQDINYVLESVKITNNTYGIQPGSDAIVLVDPQLDTNSSHSVTNVGDCDVTYINPDFLSLRTTLAGTTDIQRVAFRYNFKAIDANNTPIQNLKVRIVDESTSVVVNNELTDSQGEISTLPTYAGVKTLHYATYSGSTATLREEHSIQAIKYIYNIIAKTFDVNQDIADTNIFLVDSSISELSKATVDVYTELETPEKFYDRAKAYLYDNYAGESSTIVSRSGSTIDAGSYNVTIDATAGSAFAVAGSTITIKASAFAGTINTTGTLTLANGSIINGSFTNISIDFATAGTYNLQNSTFSGTLTVSNSSGGAVTVKVLPGTTVVNNGPNITVDDTETGLVTAPNIIDGSRYQLYNVTQTNEIANGLVSGGS